MLPYILVDPNEAMTDIANDCSTLVEWFRDYHLTLNADKCHLIVIRQSGILGDTLL